MHKDAELIGVFGRRGSGKSTLAKALLKGRPKVVAFDPRAEYAGRGWTKVGDRAGVLKAMKARWSKGFKIAYVPPGGGELEALHFLSMLCWQAQAPYDSGNDQRKLTLVVEEADLSIPNHALAADRRGIQRVINQGRHVGLEVIAVSQRPGLVSSTFRANCARTYVFTLPNPADVKAAAEMVGHEAVHTLKSLEPYSFAIIQDGKLSTGRTTRNGQIRA